MLLVNASVTHSAGLNCTDDWTHIRTWNPTVRRLGFFFFLSSFFLPPPPFSGVLTSEIGQPRCLSSCTAVRHTYVLTPWCRVLLEKLTGLQLVEKFPAFLWNPKFHYRTHKRPPTVPILGQPNPVHIPTSHLLEIHPNIIHPSTPRSPQWSLSFRFPHQDPIRPPLLTHTCHMPSPSHSSRFYHPHNIGWGVPIM